MGGCRSDPGRRPDSPVRVETSSHRVRGLRSRRRGAVLGPTTSQLLQWRRCHGSICGASGTSRTSARTLIPQATCGSTVATAAVLYRALVDAGWSGLGSSGHGRDTDPDRGPRRPWNECAADPEGPRGPPRDVRDDEAAGIHPRAVLRRLPVPRRCAERGGACDATARAAPPVFAAGIQACSRRAASPIIRIRSPSPPNRPSSNDPDYTEFSQLPRLASVLDRLQRLYGSRRRFPIWVTEYAYITNPPNHSLPFVSPSTAAKYINWAEYLSYKNSRIANTMQFLLEDPNPSVGVPEFGGFASGLEFFGGKAQAELRGLPHAAVPPGDVGPAQPRRRGLGMCQARPRRVNWRRIARRASRSSSSAARAGHSRRSGRSASRARAATLTCTSPSRQAARFGCSGAAPARSTAAPNGSRCVDAPSRNATPPTTTTAPQHRRRGARGQRRHGRSSHTVARGSSAAGDVSGHGGDPG